MFSFYLANRLPCQHFTWPRETMHDTNAKHLQCKRQRAVLTDRLFGISGEVYGTDGGVGVAVGWWWRITEFERVAHFIILVYSLPFVAATKDWINEPDSKK